MPTVQIENIEVYFSRNLTDPGYKVRDSYRLKTKQDIERFLEKLWVTKDYIELCSIFKFTRTDQSQREEIAAHNLLYRLGMYKTRTKDSDVNNNETTCRLLGYKILSHFYK